MSVGTEDAIALRLAANEARDHANKLRQHARAIRSLSRRTIDAIGGTTTKQDAKMLGYLEKVGNELENAANALTQGARRANSAAQEIYAQQGGRRPGGH